MIDNMVPYEINFDDFIAMAEVQEALPIVTGNDKPITISRPLIGHDFEGLTITAVIGYNSSGFYLVQLNFDNPIMNPGGSNIRVNQNFEAI